MKRDLAEGEGFVSFAGHFGCIYPIPTNPR